MAQEVSTIADAVPLPAVEQWQPPDETGDGRVRGFVARASDNWTEVARDLMALASRAFELSTSLDAIASKPAQSNDTGDAADHSAEETIEPSLLTKSRKLS